MLPHFYTKSVDVFHCLSNSVISLWRDYPGKFGVFEITVYAVHLADIKFGELVCDVNWRIFSLATRVIQIT